MPAAEQVTTNENQSKKNRGWIKVHRAIADHPLWEAEPFSKGQAWIDLLLRANHDDREFVLGNQVIAVVRGEIVTSDVKLSTSWRWSRHKVRSFLDLLKNLGMIDLKRDTKKTHITILNYNTYQACDDSERTSKGQRRDNDGTTTGHNQELLRTIKNKEEEREEGADAPSAPAQDPIAPKPKLHPSPKAPRHLKRKAEELIPYPGEDSKVFLTQTEINKLIARFRFKGAQDPEYEAESYAKRLHNYSAKKQFYEYVDHYLTIWNWANRDEAKQRTND